MIKSYSNMCMCCFGTYERRRSIASFDFNRGLLLRSDISSYSVINWLLIWYNYATTTKPQNISFLLECWKRYLKALLQKQVSQNPKGFSKTGFSKPYWCFENRFLKTLGLLVFWKTVSTGVLKNQKWMQLRCNHFWFFEKPPFNSVAPQQI